MNVRVDRIDSMEIRKSSYSSWIDLEVEFTDDDEVIQGFGAQACVDALDETKVYDALGGWKNAKDFYAEEIEEMIEAKLQELAAESERVPDA